MRPAGLLRNCRLCRNSLSARSTALVHVNRFFRRTLYRRSYHQRAPSHSHCQALGVQTIRSSLSSRQGMSGSRRQGWGMRRGYADAHHPQQFPVTPLVPFRPSRHPGRNCRYPSARDGGGEEGTQTRNPIVLPVQAGWRRFFIGRQCIGAIG